MLRQWLGDVPVERFRQAEFGRVPHAMPGTAKQTVALFTWDVLDRVLAAQPAPDVLVARNGRHHDVPAPRSLAAARPMLAEGFSLVVRRAEDHDAGMRRLADEFLQDVPGTVTIQLFVTPAGFHGFGWHYDAEEVFIVQTAGCKEYLMRQNTVNPRPTPENMPRDLQFEREKTPVHAATLIAGDWLHIPCGWWHMALCSEDSLSISLGVVPRTPRR